MDSRTSLAIGAGSWLAGTINAVVTDDRIVTAMAIVGGIAITGVAIWQRVQDGRDNHFRKQADDAWKLVREREAEIKQKDDTIDELRDAKRRDRDEVHHYRNVANRLSLHLRRLGEDPGDINYVAYDQEVERDHSPYPGDAVRHRDPGVPGPKGGDAPGAGDPASG